MKSKTQMKRILHEYTNKNSKHKCNQVASSEYVKSN
jgi:hypothetical protein